MEKTGRGWVVLKLPNAYSPLKKVRLSLRTNQKPSKTFRSSVTILKVFIFTLLQVICFASFIGNLIIDGIAYSFGIMLNDLVEHFDSNAASVAWVGSLIPGKIRMSSVYIAFKIIFNPPLLLPGLYQGSGPIVGGLVN